MDFLWQRIPRLQNTVCPSRVFLRFDLADCKDFQRPQLFHLNTEMFVNHGFGHFVVVKRVLLDFERPLEKFNNRFGLSNTCVG